MKGKRSVSIDVLSCMFSSVCSNLVSAEISIVEVVMRKTFTAAQGTFTVSYVNDVYALAVARSIVNSTANTFNMQKLMLHEVWDRNYNLSLKGRK